MAHFISLFERAAREALREIRMRQAAILLTNDSMSIDQITPAVGYKSRSSFLRTYRKAYGTTLRTIAPPHGTCLNSRIPTVDNFDSSQPDHTE